MTSASPNTTDSVQRTTTPYIRPFSDDAIVVSAVFLLTMMVFGIFANLLTLAVIISSKKLWSIFNLLIVSLCISDLLSALISPLALHRRTWGFDDWFISGSLCKIFWAVDTWTNYVTSLHILLFGIARLLSIQWPLTYRKIKKKHITITAVAIWATTFFIACIPRWMWYEAFPRDRYADTIDAKFPSCTINLEWLTEYRIYYNIAFPLLIYAPMGMTAILSPAIGVLLWKLRKRRALLKSQTSPIADNSHSTQELKTRKRERHAIIQLFFITGSFMFGYIPITAYTFYTTNVKTSTLEGKINDWNFGMMAYISLRLSECLNPIFYNLASAKMRKATMMFVKTKLCCACRKGAPQSSGAISDGSTSAKKSGVLEL